MTYTIEFRPGYSQYDHLRPTCDAGPYYSLASARSALRDGIKAQGGCAWESKQVRMDIVRNDGRRFDWENVPAGRGLLLHGLAARISNTDTTTLQ